MRHFVPLRILLLLAALLSSSAGCRRREASRLPQTEEEAPRLASTVHVADARAASQLVSGWHDIEQNSWRWTAGHFSAILRPPRAASQKGATLQLRFTLPGAVVQKLGAIGMGASVNGVALPPESYTQPGEFIYSRDVPPNLLQGESVKVDFSLDKSLPPGAVDQRELGVIASSVGLEPK